MCPGTRFTRGCWCEQGNAAAGAMEDHQDGRDRERKERERRRRRRKKKEKEKKKRKKEKKKRKKRRGDSPQARRPAPGRTHFSLAEILVLADVAVQY